MPKYLFSKEIEANNLQTRNAVETAIDLAKGDRAVTWEGGASRLRGAIKPWEAVSVPRKVKK